MYNDNRRATNHNNERRDSRPERNDQRHDQRNDHRHDHRREHGHQKKYSKSLILLKSSVFALFIVLVVSIAAFEMVRNHRESKNNFAAKCGEVAKINIAHGIESIKEHDGVLLVLTKSVDGKQELIRLNSTCGKEINRIKFEIK